MIPFTVRLLEDGLPKKWCEGVPNEPIDPYMEYVREISMEFLYRHGKDITGSVLNCGSNNDLYAYWRFFPKCSKYRLLDLKTPTQWIGKPREVIIADVQDMPQIPTDSEECIIAYWLLYYLSNHRSALAEFKRVLKPNGTLLIMFMASAYEDTANVLSRWTHVEACEMLDPFFKVDEAELCCEIFPCPVKPHITKSWSRFIVDGRRHLMTFIKASPI